jgi:hypothetical protein
METGIKALDKLISQYGLSFQLGHDEFQRVVSFRGGDERAKLLKLPFCFYQIISHLAVTKQVTLHHFYLPYRGARLASYLIDEQGVVLEQVYYLREAKYIKACRKIKLALERQYQGELQLVA